MSGKSPPPPPRHSPLFCVIGHQLTQVQVSTEQNPTEHQHTPVQGPWPQLRPHSYCLLFDSISYDHARLIVCYLSVQLIAEHTDTVKLTDRSR